MSGSVTAPQLVDPKDNGLQALRNLSNLRTGSNPFSGLMLKEFVSSRDESRNVSRSAGDPPTLSNHDLGNRLAEVLRAPNNERKVSCGPRSLQPSLSLTDGGPFSLAQPVRLQEAAHLSRRLGARFALPSRSGIGALPSLWRTGPVPNRHGPQLTREGVWAYGYQGIAGLGAGGWGYIFGMRTQTSAEETAEQIVCLRKLLPEQKGPAERQMLARVIRQLRTALGPTIPKRAAAAVFRISPQSLGRLVREGALPMTRRPGSSRELLLSEALLLVAAEASRLREAGEVHPVAKAVRTLNATGRMPRVLRPNASAAELIYEYEHTTPAERLRAGEALSRAAFTLAGRAR